MSGEAASPDSSRSVFVGGGDMGRVMASWDWSATSVGLPQEWPAALRGVVQILLTSRFSMWMAWGPELAFFYNDAYRRDTLRAKHPWALGRPAREVWAEIWDDIGPRIASVLDTGEATWDEGLLLFLERAGYVEETYHTFSYSPLRDEDGTVAGFLCVVSEDTERVLAERRLRVLSELGDISAVSAPTVDAACASALEVLQRGRSDVPFASIYLLEPDGQTARRAGFYGLVDQQPVAPEVLDRARHPDAPLWPLLDTGEPQLLEGLAGDYAGLFVPLDEPVPARDPDSVVALPLTGGGAGRPVGVLFMGISPFRALDEEYRRFVDLVARGVDTAITDARTLQAQLRRADELAELDRAKTEFFTGVSHELRTPLTLIAGPAEDGLADTADPLSPGQRRRMELISRNSARLRRLVDTLLDFARLEAARLVPTPRAVDLATLTRGIAESFAPAVARAELGFDIDCEPLPEAVMVDVDMWEKIVLNLLSNAVKFTHSGQISIALRSTVDGGVALVVSDTGIGIPEADRPLLFQRFYRVLEAAGRSHEGSGIGLALVAELTALHQGTVAVDSVEGAGSTFTVTLPATALTRTSLVSAHASSTTELYREEALQWSGPLVVDAEFGEVVPEGETAVGARVLVVEDNRDLRGFLAGLLAPHFTVLQAGDGKTALEIVRAEDPDLVLTDVMMPELDGFELLAALRADPASAATPVIMLSARAAEEAAIEGLAAGADDYLVKPFSPADLLARVRSTLAMARLRSHDGAWRAAVINALQDGFFTVNAAGEVVEINDAFGAMFGYGTEGLPYPPPHPWWPDPVADPDGHAQVIAAFAAVQETGRGHYVLPLRHRDGHRVWADCSADTVPDRDGNGAMVVGVARDVTAARWIEQRDRLLAETGRLLTQPADLAERLTALARVAVPVLADLVVVSLAGPDGRFSTVAAVHRSEPEVAEALLSEPPHTIPDTLLTRYRGGHAFLVAQVSGEWWAQEPVDEADPSGRRGVERPSRLVVPLVVAGRLLGSLSFVTTARARWHDDAELLLAEELGRRVAGVVEADRVATREQQLHAGTVALAAAGTLATAAAALSSAVTSALGAAGTAIYVVGPDDPDLHLIHSVGYPPQVAQSFTRIRADSDLPAAAAARTRTGVWLGDQQAWLNRYPHMAVPGAAEDVHALAALPLIMAEHVVGVLAASFPTGRAFPADERSFAMALVALAAQAFERAAHSDAQEAIARTLQRSLLPARLPTHPRLALAARYLPAGQHTQAGGDWYDVIDLDGDRVAIVVGDVVGSGPAAAAVMGQLRSALGFLLKNNQSPAMALSWLSRYTRHVPAARGSSAIVIVLHPDTGELRWARAGHPPPLLMDPAAGPGQACYLEDAYGPVLGYPETPSLTQYVEGHGVLAPGATVVLYTDGLVERRGEVIDEGLDRLAAAAASHLDTSPEALVPALLAAGLAGTGPTDDVALIVARLLPAALRQRRPAVPTQLSALRRTVTAWATAAGLPTPMVEDLRLALGEAVANSIEHAYLDSSSPGEFTYQLERTPDGAVHVEVRDDGTWRPPPADPGYRGRGLALINVLGGDATVDTTGPGTCIRFTLPAQPAEAVVEAIRSDPAPASVGPSVELRAEPHPAGATTLYLGGDIDLTTIDARRGELFDTLRRTSGEIILDTSDVTYLASAGVGLLLEALQMAAGRIRLRTRAGSPTARILALTGLDDVGS